MSAALLTTHRDNALAAIDANDWSKAKKAIASMAVVLTSTPNSALAGSTQLSWNNTLEQLRQTLKDAKQEAELATTEGCGISVCNLEWAPPSGGCGC